MQEKKNYTSKRLGVRYGRRNRDKVGKIEATSRSKHICPKCKTKNVKRVSMGIWQCRKCNVKFTSRAYTVDKVPSLKDTGARPPEVVEFVAEPVSKE
jgi:large subunit ribosomal protein L37Ae